MTHKTFTYAATFVGTASCFRLATDPEDRTQPTPTIELTGRLSMPDAPTGIPVERRAHIKVTRARRAHFSLHLLGDETSGYLRVSDYDFDFLVRALTARPHARIEIVGAIEVDPAVDIDATRFDVSYYDLSVS